jgi:hypothetical protein
MNENQQPALALSPDGEALPPQSPIITSPLPTKNQMKKESTNIGKVIVDQPVPLGNVMPNHFSIPPSFMELEKPPASLTPYPRLTDLNKSETSTTHGTREYHNTPHPEYGPPFWVSEWKLASRENLQLYWRALQQAYYNSVIECEVAQKWMDKISNDPFSTKEHGDHLTYYLRSYQHYWRRADGVLQVMQELWRGLDVSARYSLGSTFFLDGSRGGFPAGDIELLPFKGTLTPEQMIEATLDGKDSKESGISVELDADEVGVDNEAAPRNRKRRRASDGRGPEIGTSARSPRGGTRRGRPRGRGKRV